MDGEVNNEVVSNETEGTCKQFALLATASLAAKPTCATSSEDVEDPTTQVSAADAEPKELDDTGAPSSDVNTDDTGAIEQTSQDA